MKPLNRMPFHLVSCIGKGIMFRAVWVFFSFYRCVSQHIFCSERFSCGRFFLCHSLFGCRYFLFFIFSYEYLHILSGGEQSHHGGGSAPFWDHIIPERILNVMDLLNDVDFYHVKFININGFLRGEDAFRLGERRRKTDSHCELYVGYLSGIELTWRSRDGICGNKCCLEIVTLYYNFNLDSFWIKK